MSHTRLYYDAPLREGECLRLNTKASQYLLHVLRLKEKATFIIFNGKKGEFLAQIIDIKKRSSAFIKILKFQCGILNPTLKVHLGQGLSKSQRMDYALQKATELGVTTITPLYSDHSNTHFDSARLKNRMSHWQSIITHASAQSQRCDVPQLHSPEPFQQTALLQHDGLKLICALGSQTIAMQKIPKPIEVTLLIGPEGGFTFDEIRLAKEHGFKCLSLGPRTLRTETATVTAISIIQKYFGDL